MAEFRQLFAGSKPIIGMIHLLPLPGYPDSPGINRVIQQAVADLRILEERGIDGVLIENEFDRPHRVKAAPETIAAMTRVTRSIVQESDRVFVGCEILLHDPQASLAVAKLSGAHFIRTDYFVDAMTRPEYGEFELDPEGLIAYRSAIDADDILILADIQVKYATMITPRSLSTSARMACLKGADAVVVTGDASGDAPAIKQLRSAVAGVENFDVPVLIGSGLDAGNAAALLVECDGAIVGTSLMQDRLVDAASVDALMQQVRRVRR
jgi:membrane complex biogenesis BtpA family protein